MLSTLLMGIVTGSYIYFITHTERGPVEVPQQTNDGEFSITADLYGGCMRGGMCASYRLMSDGRYTYEGPDDEGGMQKQVSGMIPAQNMEELHILMKGADLQEVTESTFEGTCPITYDGVAVEYEIVSEGNEYFVDTCVHDVADEQLFQELEDLFVQFERVHSEDEGT